MQTCAKWLDRLSVAFIVAAAGCGMLLGSGVSATSRSVFQLFAAAAFLASAACMMAEGRWRVVKSPLLFLPAVLAAYAIVQLAPLRGMGQYRATSPWVSTNPSTTLLISANRHATLQGAFLLVGAAMLTVAAAQQLRSTRRIRAVAVSLSMLLVASCPIGGLQHLSNSRKPFGMVAISNATPMLRDIYSNESAIGLAAYRVWDEMPVSQRQKSEPSNLSPFFAATDPGLSPFAGFLHPIQWSACAVLLLPLLIVGAAQFATRAAVNGRTEWFGTWEGKRSLAWLAFSLVLAGLATWFGDPFAVPAALMAATVCGILAVHGSERGRFFRLALTANLVAFSVGMVRIGTAGGLDFLKDRILQSAADDQSLLRAFADHRWLGCGIGAIGDLWTIYRPTAFDGQLRVSSLLTHAVEIGWFGVAIVAFATLFAIGQWFWIRNRLDAQARLMVVGLFTAFISALAFAAIGPGMEAPVVLSVAAVLLGCLARGLCGGFGTGYLGLSS